MINALVTQRGLLLLYTCVFLNILGYVVKCVGGGVCMCMGWNCLCGCGGGVCVWGGWCLCVRIAYSSEDLPLTTHRHTEDLEHNEDLNTGPRNVNGLKRLKIRYTQGIPPL